MNKVKAIYSVLVIITLVLFSISLVSAMKLRSDRLVEKKIDRDVVVRNDCCEDLDLMIAWKTPSGFYDRRGGSIPSCYYGYFKSGTDERLAVRDPLIWIRAFGDESSFTGTEVIEDFIGEIRYGWKRHYLVIDADGDYALNMSGCPRKCCFPRKCNADDLPKACDCGCLSLD